MPTYASRSVLHREPSELLSELAPSKAHYRPRCPWCNELLQKERGDIHEHLAMRFAVPKSKQHLITCVQNRVLPYHECHMRLGQTSEMARRSLLRVLDVVRSKQVGLGYAILRRLHGLDVPIGTVPAENDGDKEWLCYVRDLLRH